MTTPAPLPEKSGDPGEWPRLSDEGAGVEPLAEALASHAAQAADRARLSLSPQRLAGEQDALVEVEATRSRTEQILDSIVDPFFVLGADLRFIFANAGAAQMAGLPRESLTGARVWDKLPHLVGTEAERAYQRARAEAAPVKFEEHHEPSDRWFEVHVYPALDGISVVYHDVTRRKRAEEALEQRARELARKNAELEQFAYVAAHDLQEPLRMIASYTQLLARRYRGQLDSDADEFIAFAVDGVTRMQGLIGDLLEFSRIGTQGRAFSRVDSGAALSDALDNLHTAIMESGARVTHGELPDVLGDEAELMQLFQNLVSNALKFRGERAPEVHISAEPKGSAWQFCVRDRGIGIAPELWGRIFVIFQRLHGRGEYKGNGIGLAICKKIVERHGGQIWVESEPGQGSSFFFTIAAPAGET